MSLNNPDPGHVDYHADQDPTQEVPSFGAISYKRFSLIIKNWLAIKHYRTSGKTMLDRPHVNKTSQVQARGCPKQGAVPAPTSNETLLRLNLAWRY